MERARAEGLSLVGPGGLLPGTNQVVETALEVRDGRALDYQPHDPASRGSENSRNGHSEKTLLTDIGPVRVAVPRDRAGSFQPQLVATSQRGLSGFNEAIISRSPKDSRPTRYKRICWNSTALTLSHELISKVTDAAAGDMASGRTGRWSVCIRCSPSMRWWSNS